MKPLRIMTIFGTRPEAIKLAPVIQKLQSDDRFEAQIVVTAQHREMLDQVLGLFKIIPHFDLDLMKENQDLATLTASIFTHLDPILKELRPDWLLVQGDTTTVLASTLNAFYHQIKIGHIEAGLRTGDKWQPFPEEINRRIASVIADRHFAPTEWARTNLLREGIPDNLINVTGNTIIDALNMVSKFPIPKEIAIYLRGNGIISGQKKLIVITAHRRENFGDPIKEICYAIKTIAEKFKSDIEIAYPVHLNPNINEPVHKILADIENITLFPPLEYISQIHLLKHAYMVLTDSGGIQEEATGLGVPCLVLRSLTERPEGIEAGVLKLVGTQGEDILREVELLLKSSDVYNKMSQAASPFGDGHASEKIVSLLSRS